MSDFDELDLPEQVMGKPVTAMTDTELVSYLKLAVLHYQGIDLPVGDGNAERAVMARMKRTYGLNAGPIIKWACWRHGARMTEGRMRGEVIGFFTFAKSMKWYTDKLYVQLQQHQQQQARQDTFEQQAAALARLEDL